MKDPVKQIHFVDIKFLPIYGIKSITDYQSKVSLDMIRKDITIIKNLNNLLSEIKQLFVVKDFNLHKTNDKIESVTQAFAILKKVLTICAIPFKIINEKKVNFVRLISDNFVLSNYISKKMSDIGEFCDFDIVAAKSVLKEDKIDLDIKKRQIYLKDFEDNILKTIEKKVSIPIHLINNMTVSINDSMPDMKGFSIRFISPTDKNLKLFNRSCCKLSINDIVVEEIILNPSECNKISFLRETIIPSSIVKYSQINVCFLFSTQQWKQIMDSDVILQICYNELVLKKKFQQRLRAPYASICLEYVDKMIEISNGEIKYKLFDNNKNTKMFYVLVEKKVVIDSKKYCRINEQTNENMLTMMMALVENDADFVLCKFAKVQPNILFFTETDTHYILTIRMIRNVDAMSNVQFFIPNFCPKNCKVLCQQEDRKIEFGIKTVEDCTISCIDCIHHRYVKIIPGGVYFILEIDKSNVIANVCRDIKISYDALLINDRKERLDQNDIILSNDV
uniref:Uncharacterized protein n=1 Tax=viral metagenome TaxID=1070528 RepID=A0A6C0CCH3_9ZZZZ